MSEVWLRLALVAAGIVVALGVALVLRRPVVHRVTTKAAGLGPGVYLFSSSTCVDCVAARARLVDALGPTGFVEIDWEDDPGPFAEFGIDAVPCTVIVTGEGMSTRFPGMPDRALEELSP
jgi:hypothetical protein